MVVGGDLFVLVFLLEVVEMDCGMDVMVDVVDGDYL